MEGEDIQERCMINPVAEKSFESEGRIEASGRNTFSREILNFK
jgi:hypothetical protein